MARTDQRFREAFNAALELCRSCGRDGELPSESALAEHLGVSRTVVRSVLQELDARGILRWQGREKTVVRKPRKTDRMAMLEEGLSLQALEPRFLDWVLRFDVPPGTTLNVARLSREFGVGAHVLQEFLSGLARFGLVERVESTSDARARPWRAAAVGFSIGAGLLEDSPIGRAAEIALTRAELVENQRLIKRFLDARDSVDPKWRSASDFHTFELVVSPAELNELNDKIGELLRTYRAPIRTGAPEDAEAVHVIYQAFPRLPASQ